MKEYDDFPPIKYFLRVLKNAPRSAYIYCQLWHKWKKKNSLVIKKKEIRKDFLITPTLFRNVILPLSSLHIIHFIEEHEDYTIDLSGMPE